MSIDNSITRCADAVSLIDSFLLTNQKSDSYNRWLERYTKHPSEHDDAFLFGKLVQAIFSGGMKGEVVDNWMPRMEEVFHNWDVEWISRLSAHDVELLATSGKVIANRTKLNAVVSNAGTVVGLISSYGSFGRYLASFEDIASMSKDLANRFTYLGEVTTEDFLRNIGFDTAKPDRHLTRWLKRMRAIDDAASPDQVLDMIYTIAEAAKVTRAKFDSAIYLFCADRNDVLESGGVCGNVPNCELCPITALCPRNIVPSVSPPPPGGASRSSPKKPEGVTSPTPRSTPNTVWNSTYAGVSIEEVKRVNPFAVPSWLNEPFGVDGSRERRGGIERLFAGMTTIDNDRIKELGRNDGKYVAFRAIVHGYAVWENGILRRCANPEETTKND
jgi:3-methyladenine DNA glycosylase Tag